MERPRPTALDHLIKGAHDAAAQHQNPVAMLSTALMVAATSPADPYVVIDNLLQGIVHIIAARIPLDRQREVAVETEIQLSELLAAWELK